MMQNPISRAMFFCIANKATVTDATCHVQQSLTACVQQTFTSRLVRCLASAMLVTCMLVLTHQVVCY